MKTFYDKNKTRYTLAASNGNSDKNWIFIPGGPGCDSSYFHELITLLALPGNVWCIDFPGNGSNDVPVENFDLWLSIFIETIHDFNAPVIVGHSFGGMLPLIFPECEALLHGLVIMNSAPCLWFEAAAQQAKKSQLPDLSADMEPLKENPNQDTFNKALDACMPYYFRPDMLEQGRSYFTNIPFAYMPAVWWQHKAIEINFCAEWIPQNVHTMIIGGEFDAITPFTLFENDPRFDRSNIQKHFIEDAGHLPWIEKPEETRWLFHDFASKL